MIEKPADILKIIRAAARAQAEPDNHEAMGDLAGSISKAIHGMNVADAFAFGASIAKGGVVVGCLPDVDMMILMGYQLGTAIEVKLASKSLAPKGTLLN